MMTGLRLVAAALAVATLLPVAVFAQAPPPPQYGTPITLEQAKKCATAAEAEARKNGWEMVIAVFNSAGHLVFLEKMDNAQFGSIDVAREKGYSSVAYRRPTKAFEDALTAPTGSRVLRLPGASPLEGGIPLLADGRLIGGIGVSGGTSQQDAQVAAACAAGLK